MGDKRRFQVTVDLFSSIFKNKNLKIADIAGGKGYLRLALLEKGYKHVTTFDPLIRKERVKKGIYIPRKFNYKLHSKDFDLIIALHPDEATDHAVFTHLPGLIVPCCIKPSVVSFNKKYTFKNWLDHLSSLIIRNYEVKKLGFDGRNTGLIIY